MLQVEIKKELEIVKRLEIDAGHRLLKHEGKCRHVHGHRYAFEIHCRAGQLDEVGRIIDFSVIKEVVGGWLDDNLDHGFIIQQGDPLEAWLDEHEQKNFVMEDPPTAENLAVLVLKVCRLGVGVANKLGAMGVEVTKVVCWETPTSRAEATAVTVTTELP